MPSSRPDHAFGADGAAGAAPVGVGRGLLALAAIALIALPFAVYWRSLSDFFMLDDFIWLKAAASHDFIDLMRRETSFATPLDPFDYPTPYVRPLVDAYFCATYRIFGFDPTAYHALNLLLHGAVGLLVAVVGRQLIGSRAAGLAAGCLFLLLPTYDYAITWVAEVTDLLFTFFYVLSLGLFVAHARGAHRKIDALYVGSVCAFALALLAKEPAITLAGVLALWALVDTPELTGATLKTVAMKLAPFAVLALVFYLGVYRREYGTISEGGVYRLDSRLFGHFWDYLKWITFPFKPEAGLAGARAVTAVAFLGMGFWALARRDRVSSFLFLWTLACLAPLSLFAHGIDRRYAYLVSVPFSLFVVAGLKSAGDHFALESRGSKIALALPLLLAVPALAMVTRSGQDWAHDQARIYEQIYAAVPEVCGPLTPGSRIVLIDSPGFDLVGIDTQVALNFSYDRVTVERYGSRETVPPSAPGQTTCTARWTGETFRAD